MERERIDYLSKLFLNGYRDDSIKTDYGKLLLIGSSSSFPFAVLLAEESAYLAKPGYISILTNSFNRNYLFNRAHLETTFINSKSIDDSFSIDDDIKEVLNYSSILFGNGLNDSLDNLNSLKYLLINYKNKLIIDATGIRILKKVDKSILKKHECKLILTPHLGEADYLFDTSLKESRDVSIYENVSKEYAKEFDITFLIKGSDSLLVNKEVTILNRHQTPSLSKAGTGDFVAGVISGFLSYNNKFEISDLEVVDYVDSLLHDIAKKLEESNLKRNIDLNDISKEIKTYYKSLKV